MKFIVSILLIALLSFAFGLYFPWWSIAVAAFVVTLILSQKPGFAFLSGFLALLLLWGTITMVRSASNDDILAHRFSALILKSDNPFLLKLLTAFLGAIVGGMAALSGSLMRRIIKPI